MEITVGQILPGKVTGITKFGAFVQLAPGRSGLVYISEIANTFVNNVADFLTVGQEVTVKVIGIDEHNRINLSIKQALPPKPQQATKYRQDQPARPREQAHPRPRPAAEPFPQEAPKSADAEFEDKLKRFMKDSEGKLSDAMRQTERRNSKRRR